MAATIARIKRERWSTQPEVHRLGHHFSEVEANTWRTFTTAHVNADGSGFIEVRRCTGKHGYRGCGNYCAEVLHYYQFGKEDA